MKAQILKISGCKTQKEFYSKFPSEEAFMKKHGEEFKKAQTGAAINASQVHQAAYKPISYSDQFDQADKMITGSTATERQAALAKQQPVTPQPQNGGGFDIAGLMKLAGGAMQGGTSATGMDTSAAIGSGKYGAYVPRAQVGGNWYANNSPAGSTDYGSTDYASEENGSDNDMGLRQSISSVSNLKPAGATYSSMPTASSPPNVGALKENTWSKVGKELGKYAGPVGDIVSGIGELKKEKEMRKAAEQARDVSKVSLKAAESTDVDARRQQSENISKQRQAQMPVNTGEEFFPIYGVGTNVLARNGARLQDGGPVGGNPTEIQNTYGEGNSLYDDLGYVPIVNPNQQKDFRYGGHLQALQDGGAADPWGAVSHQATGMGQSLMGGQNAGGKIGGTAGKAIGNAIVPGVGGAVGEFVGGIAGNLLDTNAKKMKKAQDVTQRNMQGMASANMAKGIQAQNQSYMEDGGWVSHDWQPQVITSFGDHSAKDVYDFAHEGMDTLRTGGNIRQNNMYQTDQYALGGEVQTTWGGGAETLSQNPYMPGSGETLMFRGNSHEESDGNGHTGIGVKYGQGSQDSYTDYAEYGTQDADANVEVERGEPAAELEDENGEKNLTVYGNLQIPNQFLHLLDDPTAKGKKFKNYVAGLSKIENKQNSIIEKASKELIDLDPVNSFDKLKLTALQASLQGANMKLKDIADKKINAASLQNSINDTAEEHGLVADDLAKGKVVVDKKAMKEQAKYGKQIFAKGGTIIDPLNQLKDLLKTKGYDYEQSSGTRAGAKTKQGRESRHSAGEAMDLTFSKLGKNAYNTMLNDPEVAQFMLDNNLTAIDEYDDDIRKQTGGSGGHLHIGLDKGTAVSDRFRNQAQALYGAKTPATDAPASAATTTTEVTKPPRMTKEEAIKAGYKLDPTTKKYTKTVKGVQTPGTATNEGTALEKIPEGQKRGTSGLYGKVTQEVFDTAKKENPWFDWTGFDPSKKADVKKYQEAFNAKAKEIGSKAYIKPDSAFGEQTASARIAQAKQQTPPADTIQIADVYDSEATTTTEETTKTNWWDKATSFANTVLPTIRPSDAEALDTAQLYPEMFAMSNNQVSPVQAQIYQPDLNVPYDISLQDQLNANQADYRAGQRMAGYNPAAQANLNAQKYQANQSVLGNQFRANQEMKNKVYGENRNILNDAKLKNLGIFDKQYERQTEALANTKATTQAALNSISDKYAKNKLEGRTLKTYENMYNYRFGPNFRAQNMNPLYQWDTQMGGEKAKGGVPEGWKATNYDANGNPTGMKRIGKDTTDADNALEDLGNQVKNLSKKNGGTAKAISRNGSIVKALKNI